MLNHEQIMKAMLLQLEDGVVIEYDQEAGQARVVFTQQSVNADYYNLLRASAVLYQCVEQQSRAVSLMLSLAAAVNAEGIVEPLQQMQTGLMLAKRIALEGVEGVAKQTDAINEQLERIYKGV